MRDLHMAFGDSCQAKSWSNKKAKFSDLKTRLCTTIRTTESVEEYAKMSKAEKEKAKAEKAKQTKKKNSVTGKVANSALNAVGREVGRSFTRGLLGVLKKWF